VTVTEQPQVLLLILRIDMKRKLIAAVTGCLLTGVFATSAFSQAAPSRQQKQQNNAMSNIPTCTASLGTLSIVNGDDSRGWMQNNLAPPEKLLRVIIQRSGCFTLVDRAAGLNAATQERNLNANLGLQRGSNVGQGQVRAADYVLVAEVAAQDRDTSGNNAAATLGGILGGRAGTIAGGIQTRKLEAQTVLSLSNVRTTEMVAVTEGHSAKTDAILAGAGSSALPARLAAVMKARTSAAS